jgi:ArsR family transcriptional regulator, arsenate/arsenite/antimonite-responsive transcriptional repressor
MASLSPIRLRPMSEAQPVVRRPLPVLGAPNLAAPRVVEEPRNLTLEVYRALADPIRLELLALIAAGGPICVCHLHERLPYSQSRVSKHLGTLRRAGLVTTRREGTWVYYSLEEEALAVARDYIDQLESSLRRPHEADYCPPAG